MIKLNTGIPSFKARLKNTEDINRLTLEEIQEGRYEKYKAALKKLDDVHKDDELYIYQSVDTKEFGAYNPKKESIAGYFKAENLTEFIKMLAEPSEKMHQQIFKCDSTEETENITKEFYA